MNLKRLVSISAVAVLLLSHVGCATRSTDDGDLAIVGVSVVPMTAELQLPDQTVVIRAGRIVSIGPSGSIRLGDKVARIDGRGRWLIPGLADMHVHIGSDTELPLYVANGVTLVRNMWGSAETLDMRRRVDRGQLLGPRMVTAGPLVDGDPPVWAVAAVVRDGDAARSEMRQQKQQGYDFLKVYTNIGSNTFDAIAAYSKEIGYPFAGHVPDSVGYERMVLGGAWSIEHLTGFDDAERTPGGPYRARAEYTSPAERLADRVALARRIQRRELDWADVFDGARRKRLAELTARQGVWSVPTLAVNRRIFTTRVQAAQERARKEMRYVDPQLLASWNPDVDFRLKRLSDEQLALLGTYFEPNLQRTLALQRAGAPLLVGTDAPNPFVVAGFAVHEELQLLVRAGLTPFEALLAATRRPAEYLRQPEDFGTVEVNRRADLVLLDADPLRDISATSRIAGVVLGGRWLPRKELDAMLDGIAQAFAIPEDWFAGIPLLSGMATPVLMKSRFNGVESGAERFGTVRQGANTIVLAQTSGREGNAYTESLEYVLSSDGTLAALDYKRRQANAVTTAKITRDGDRWRMEAAAADGSRVQDTVVAPGATPVACNLSSCLVSMLPVFRSIAPGETRSMGVLSLDLFPKLALVNEEWVVKRGSDTQRYTAQVEMRRGKSRRTLRLELDDAGLTTVIYETDLGNFETSVQR